MIENQDNLGKVNPELKEVISKRPQVVPDPLKVLEELGYTE